MLARLSIVHATTIQLNSLCGSTAAVIQEVLPMPFFKFRDLQLHYVDAADCGDSCGVPVVFVHGAGSSHAIWTLQIQHFAPERRVIALDLSGHGQSDSAEGEADIVDDYAQEIGALLDHLDLDRFVLVGHSMGGGAVMAYLLSQPVRRPVAVALVDTSPDLDLSKIAPGLVIEAVESYFFLIKKRMTDKESLAYKICKEEEDRKREHPETVRRDLRACDRFDIADRVGDIDLPVFVIHGDDDDIIPLGVAEELVRRLPRADIAIVRGSDHCPMVQQPEEFNRLLGKFLDWVDRKFGPH